MVLKQSKGVGNELNSTDCLASGKSQAIQGCMWKPLSVALLVKHCGSFSSSICIASATSLAGSLICDLAAAVTML